MQRKNLQMKNLSRREFLTKTGQAGLLLASSTIASTGGNQDNSKTTRQKIAIFSKHLQWLDYKGMAETAAEIGFDGVDLTVRRRGHVSPGNVEDDLPEAVEACKKAGIEVIMLSTDIRDVSQSKTEKIIRTASQLGIKYYRMDWYYYDKSNSLDKNLENFKSKMKDLAAINEQYQIKGAYQNNIKNKLGVPVWDLGMILREIDSEWLGCQYDIRHATMAGPFSWPLNLELIAPFIHTIDIKDSQWTVIDGKLKFQYVPLGEGMIDFKQFIKYLKKFNIHAPFSVHVEYNLGGVNHGTRRLRISKEEVVEAMRKDLNKLKSLI
jgi:sugar phosphate isomerase/epimerase